jgi:hypothetical protein
MRTPLINVWINIPKPVIGTSFKIALRWKRTMVRGASNLAGLEDRAKALEVRGWRQLHFALNLK